MRETRWFLNFFALLSAVALFGGCMSFKVYVPAAQHDYTDASLARLRSLLDDSVNEFKLPGLQAGILEPGKQALLAASGTVDLEHRGEAIGNHSSFRIGSSTKMFVAALVCRLAERGLLSLDDRIDTWFPEYPESANICVQDLLNQSSGIKESLFTDAGMMAVSVLDSKKRWQAAEVMKILSKKSKPGVQTTRRFSYANDNYLLLGLIAESAGSASLASQLESEFFIPLGMHDTCLLPWADRLPNGTTPGYDEFIPFGPHLIGREQTSWDSLTFAAGAMSSSAHDLLLWLDALFHGRVVSEKSLAAMRTRLDARENGRDNNITGYGLGIAGYELDGFFLEGHPGGGFGGECFPFYESKSDTSYVVVYNVSRKDNPAGKEILKRMMGASDNPVGYQSCLTDSSQ